MRAAVIVLFACCGCEQILGIKDLSGGSNADAGKGHPDAPATTGDGATCSAAASYVPAFGPEQEAVLEDPDPPQFTDRIEWTGQLSDQPPVTLELEIVGGGGSNTPDWPDALGPIGELNLAGASDAVVLLLANFGSDGSPRDTYLAEQGTLSLSDAEAKVGGKIDGILANLSLVHVDAQGTGFIADPDGCKSTIDNASFSAMVMTSP